VAWPAVGALVRVRREDEVSVVALSNRVRAEGLGDVPDIEVCCVPSVVVRTPVDGAALRWVQISDLTAVEELAGA
jgi:hypothetical protein